MKSRKKWEWLGNEIRWGRRGRLAYIVNIGDVELVLDDDGEVVEVAIRNPEKYIDKEILDKIAVKYPHPTQAVKKTIRALGEVG